METLIWRNLLDTVHEAVHGKEEHRKPKSHDAAELPVHPQHHSNNRGERQDIDQKRQKGRDRDFTHSIYVVSHTSNEVPGSVAAVKRKRQVGEVSEEFCANLREDT